ncbi:MULTISPECIES: CHC2 zinc finger domain-containing protein [unclassified Bradyrhizobium]|uniref:DUF7146 domain-containing protein n=1 Tax=unclassified Bradyrhizobium TaxID=2631580 RepID=UPI002916E526|nr:MULTISPECIES: CHC2 zinc finger domain-containing protein [unclassified Bradyrhizobium]
MSLLTPADIEDIKARNPLRDVAAQYVQLRRSGKRLAGPCPMCGGKNRSGRFEILEDGGSWVCAVCQDGGDVIRLVQRVEGLDFKDAIERLGGTREIDPDVVARLIRQREDKQRRREAQAARYREAERTRLFEQWSAARPIHGTIAARYLEGRGLILPPTCPGLRFAPEAAYFHGDEFDEFGRKNARVIHRGPAMLAAFIRPDGHFGGLHQTWLVDGAPPLKLQLEDPDEPGVMLPAKKMRGSKTGAFILVAPAEGAARCLVVGEGIETVLSAYTAHVDGGRNISDVAWWAAGDLGNMAGPADRTLEHPHEHQPNGRPKRIPGPMPDLAKPGLSIPDEVAELILLGDGDSERVLTGHAMVRAARRYARAGRIIRIAFAPAGRDFNDLLQDT